MYHQIPDEEFEIRFWLTKKVSEQGCWIWLKRLGHHAYGRIMRDRLDWYVHRLAWTLVNGSIPDGMDVLHSCDVTSCFNPEHLFLGTQADNVRDMDKKGRRGIRGPAKEEVPGAEPPAPEDHGQQS